MSTSENVSFTRIAEAKKSDLIKAADYFGVTLADGANVEEIRATYREDGIDDGQWSRYDADVEAREKAIEEAKIAAEAQKEAVVENAPADEPTAPTAPEEVKTLLIKMVRRNPSMSVRGYKFTQKHPYQVVPLNDAEFIVAHYKGFSVATPSEVESFYDK